MSEEGTVSADTIIIYACPSEGCNGTFKSAQLEKCLQRRVEKIRCTTCNRSHMITSLRELQALQESSHSPSVESESSHSPSVESERSESSHAKQKDSSLAGRLSHGTSCVQQVCVFVNHFTKESSSDLTICLKHDTDAITYLHVHTSRGGFRPGSCWTMPKVKSLKCDEDLAKVASSALAGTTSEIESAKSAIQATCSRISKSAEYSILGLDGSNLIGSEELFKHFESDLDRAEVVVRYLREGSYKSSVYYLDSTFAPEFGWEVKVCGELENGRRKPQSLNSLSVGNGVFASKETKANEHFGDRWIKVEKKLIELCRQVKEKDVDVLSDKLGSLNVK